MNFYLSFLLNMSQLAIIMVANDVSKQNSAFTTTALHKGSIQKRTRRIHRMKCTRHAITVYSSRLACRPGKHNMTQWVHGCILAHDNDVPLAHDVKLYQQWRR